MDFSKWDRIFMTHRQCADLFDFVNADELENDNHPMRNYDMYPLHRFMLTMPNVTDDSGNDSILHHCYTLAGDHLDIRSYIEHKGQILEAFFLSIDAIKLTLKKKSGPACEEVEKKFYNNLTYWQWLLLQFMLINTYILSDPEKTTDIEVREVQAKKLPDGVQRNRPPRKGPNKVRFVRSYRLKKNWKTAVKKRIQQIKCKAWGVRGHFRHYKDGRVVFVHPYVKGKKRDEYKGKIYELFPKNEIKMEGEITQ